jgi:hypothetical protein
LRALGVAYRPRDWGLESDIERLGIDIGADAVAHWKLLLAEIQLHSAADEPILAFPDMPEAYFLSNRTSPVRWSYDFFGPLVSYAEYAAIADQQRVPVLVVNLRPEFSRPPAPSELLQLRATFPHVKRLDDTLVMWRSGPAPSASTQPAEVTP